MVFFIKICLVFIFLNCCFLENTCAGIESVTMLAFGDSITQGLKRNEYGSIWGIVYPVYGARIGGYEPHLEAVFTSNNQTANYFVAYVHNWGSRGERTSTGLERLNSILASSPGTYDYCLLMEGANDLYEGLSASTTAFNLSKMVDSCSSAGVTPVMATITPNSTGNYNTQITADYNPKIKAVASDKNVILADQNAAVSPNWWELTSGDGLHLSDDGDQVMATTWFNALMKDERFKVPPPAFLPAAYLLLLNK